MKLSCLMSGIEIAETNIENFDIEVGDIADNSEEVGENDVFICLAGRSDDGHKYIENALQKRAAVIVIEKKRYEGDYLYIRVKNTRAAFACMWNNACGRPAGKIKLIAVTGTNGKSSTVEMISHILSLNQNRTAKIGTLNGNMTTPDPPQLYPRLAELVNEGYEYVVMEASSHALALDKLDPLHFIIGIFTNLTPEHLDFHGNMEGYAKAKAKLFAKCGICIYNRDDKYADMVTGESKKRLSYSLTDESADYSAKNIKISLKKTEFDFLASGELFHIETSLIGSFTVYNALCACACARVLGIAPQVIKNAMKSLCGVPGRLERVHIKSQDYSAFIDYAHTPDALSKVLDTVRECMPDSSRLVCIFGCGGDRDKSKRAPMGSIASAAADYVIVTSDNSRSEEPFDIIRDIVKGIGESAKYLIIADRRRAIEYAVHCAKPGDILLFCGKGHENYEINHLGKFPFNEKEIIMEADKERIERIQNEHNSC